MKTLKFGFSLFLMAIAGVGAAMAATNPGPSAYEDYAVAQLQKQLNDRVCGQAPVFLNDVCGSVIDNNQDWLYDAVAENTQRQNFVVLSVYRTDLSTSDALERILPSGLALSVDGLPAYRAETVGIFSQFYTFRAKRIQE